MRIIFVRHGHPDYINDCLTPLGRQHAEAVAMRLKDEPIERIYASTCGRAIETAEHIDAWKGLGVRELSFMREIKWGSTDENPIFEDGHPWRVSDYLVEQGQTIMNPGWKGEKIYRRNKVIESVEAIAENFDDWLAKHGYVREGEYYRVGNVTYKTVAMVSHGGASSAVFSHLFNLPFPFVCSAICPDYTAVTVVSFSEEEGALIAPKFEILNDARHIETLGKKTKTTVFDR